MAVYDTRILDILVPRLSVEKDDYGNEPLRLRPLSLDRVLEGHGLLSSAALFQLPTEILTEILNFVDEATLASLALVNRDSLQLARSRMFANILLDYSPQSLSLINVLLGEGAERARSATSSTRRPSLGACIRKVTLATNPKYVIARHNISLDSLNDEITVAKMAAVEHATREFCNKYMSNVGAIIERSIMSHLETLDWQDQVVMRPPLFKALVSSSIKHLKFRHLQVTEEFKAEEQDLASSCCLPLQTLHLNLIWDISNPTLGSMARLFTILLRLCAPTLQSLAAVTTSTAGAEPFALMTRPDEHWYFPSLRKLKLTSVPFTDSTALEALVTDKLRILIVNTEVGSAYQEYFQQRGRIQLLETFVWDVVLGSNQSLDFLKSNAQLKKLCVTHPIPPLLLERGILPLLSSSFKHLQSLSFIWDCSHTPVAALDILSTLETLEQIHLSAGAQHGLRYDWLIEHTAVRTSLSCLQNLKRIAFSRDSYLNMDQISYHGSYYEHRSYLTSNLDPLDVELLDLHSAGERFLVWERLHRQKMVSIANRYAIVMPALEWICVGQTPMAIETGTQPAGQRRIIPLCTERDECKTYIAKIFGGNMAED